MLTFGSCDIITFGCCFDFTEILVSPLFLCFHPPLLSVCCGFFRLFIDTLANVVCDMSYDKIDITSAANMTLKKI